MTRNPVAGPPRTRDEIERYLTETLPALGPRRRGEEGLADARRFFARVGSPQDAAPQVHVVGTAGKGSVVLDLVALAAGAGVQVAAHCSPHVYDLRERFVGGGGLPTWDDLGEALAEVWPAIEAETALDGRPPGFFELTNLLAWVLGRRSGAELLVTEAGIGGRVDFTNAIGRPDKLTVVTPIGYDHLELLGPDLRGIAREKAAVIPEGGTVVRAAQPWPEAAAVVDQVARERGATVVEAGPDGAAATAWAELARRHGWEPSPSPRPLDRPGRLERVRLGERVVTFDGAHNPLKLRWLRDRLPTPPDLVVAALSREKDLEACAAELARLGPAVVATEFSVTAGDRVVRGSWPAADLADAVRGHGAPATPARSLDEAAGAIRCSTATEVLVTGSFMVLDPLRRALDGHPTGNESNDPS